MRKRAYDGSVDDFYNALMDALEILKEEARQEKANARDSLDNQYYGGMKSGIHDAIDAARKIYKYGYYY